MLEKFDETTQNILKELEKNSKRVLEYITGDSRVFV